MEHPGSIGHQDHAKDVRLAPESVDQGVAPKYLHWAGIFGSFWWVKTRINHPELDGLYMFIPSGYIHLLRFYGSSSSLILGNQVGWMGRLLFRWPASSEILLPPAIHNMKNPGWGQLQVAMIGDVEKNNKTLTSHENPCQISRGFQFFVRPTQALHRFRPSALRTLWRWARAHLSWSNGAVYHRHPLARRFDRTPIFAHIHDESLILNLIMRSSISMSRQSLPCWIPSFHNFHSHLVGGDWNMTFMTSHSVGNVIIPTDELTFFRGVGWNHQPVIDCTHCHQYPGSILG